MHARSWLIVMAGLGVVVLGVLVARRIASAGPAPVAAGAGPAPVEVAPVLVGTIEDRRTFSGTLEAVARVTIAPKVAGRIVGLPVDVGDGIERGRVVARLDSAEYEQAEALAAADVAVAEAGVAQARAAYDNARLEFERVQTLREHQDAAQAELDAARAALLAREAAVQSAQAQVARATAALAAARIRLGYTTITADWEGGDDRRVVAERLAEEGDTVSANTPLLSIVELDPIDAVIHATERDYAWFSPGQPVTLTTDAHPGRRWEGHVSRIAPVFREGSRQARVEVRVPNADGALKPGMFARVEAVLGVAEDATIVPVGALALRGGRTVVFVVDDAGATARMVPVEVGIRSADRVQVTGEALTGRVVTLGQQLLGDESAVTIPEPSAPGAPTAARTAGSGG